MEHTSKETYPENGAAVLEKLHELEVAQATQAAATVGAQTTLAATGAGGLATGAASLAGLAASIATGAVSFVVGIFLGLAIANTHWRK